jgi:hypothetical protein
MAEECVMRQTRLWWVLGGLVALLVAIQLVPYGRAHRNPPVGAEPAWDSPRTRDLAERACFACHGNTTTWPWYSTIAPVSWYVQRDVNEGRSKRMAHWTVSLPRISTGCTSCPDRAACRGGRAGWHG